MAKKARTFSKRRIFGVPIGIIGVLMAVMAVAASWFAVANVPTSVEVIGGDVALWSDAGCNTTLTTLEYTLYRDAVSDNITIWAENTGTAPIYIGLANNGLDATMSQYVDGSTLVPAEPARVQVGIISPDSVLAFSLTVETSGNTTTGSHPFTTIVEASETPYT